MEDLLGRLFPGWGGAGSEPRRGSKQLRRSRRKTKGAIAEPTAAAAQQRDTRAFHESLWRVGNLPPGVPPPRTEMLKILGHSTAQVVTTNVLVAFLAAPGVGVRSLIQRVRFGNMKRTMMDIPYATPPPQYLCDGSVYTLGMARLPLDGFLTSGLATSSDHMAVVLAYAVNSPASLEAAKELQSALIRSMQQRRAESQHQQVDKQRKGRSRRGREKITDLEQGLGQTVEPKAAEPDRPPPFPVMLLGLQADLPRHRDLEGNGPGRQHESPQGDGIGPAPPATEDIEARRRKLEAWGFEWSRTMLHAEVSAKTGDGVLEALGRLVEGVDAAAKVDADAGATLEDMRDHWIPAVAQVAEDTARADRSTAR
ncbi:hypothetical protein MAPG_09268 [Magnaporthiopsis poae ATCC 64411]|uniref:Uncharacterized protein n=1 Tax=Magnaporthiopsis poae (strain ATCC 64411 / 73-15) TaxID=644358 RepID=A0A0C4E9I0_MAGP6|nr:hypothetical protein MAPG_09268 [Magnaporthiopsis poae ATCC 64411]